MAGRRPCRPGRDRAFFSQESAAYASVVAARILSEARNLAEFPRIGRRVREWDDENVGERIVFSYRLINQLGETDIKVRAVIHGARLLPDDVRIR